MLWHHLQDVITGLHVFVLIGLYNYAVPPKIKMKGEKTDCVCIQTGAWLQHTTLSHAPRGADLWLASLGRSMHLFSSWIYRFILWVFCLHVCLHATCKLGARSNQRRTLNALELEFRTAVSCHVSAGNRTYILCKEKYFYPLNHLSSPWVNFLKTTRYSPFFLFPLLPTSLCFLFLENLSTLCK